MSTAEVPRQDRSRKLLLVGWDAADWRVIRPLLTAGQMPALQSLIDDGVSGNITTLQPILSPMLWTSIATGKRPFKHGVLGFAESDPATGGIRGVTSLTRRGKAVWNILNQNGLRTNVIGWWPSHPAEPIDGVMVSNHYQEPAGTPAGWAMPAGVVSPERLTDVLKERRVHPDDVVSEQVLRFAPKLAELSGADIRNVEHARILALKQCIARAASIQAAAAAIIEAEPWDFMAVYFDAIDHFGHGFMRFHPPRQAWIAPRAFDLYGDVVNAAYRFHDDLLGTLLRAASITPETTVLVLSDHGFHSDHLRVTHVPRASTGPAVEHRELGILVARGPGIRKGAALGGASVIDVTPTILTLFGIRTGEDMDGTPLASIFTDPIDRGTIPSWDDVPESVPGAAGMHAPDRRVEPEEAREALAHLVALGYVEPPTQNAVDAVTRTAQQAHYDLALSWMDAGAPGLALPILAALWRERPLDYRVALQLAHALEALGRGPEQRRVLETVIARRHAQADAARDEIAALKDRIASGGGMLTQQERTRYETLRPLSTVSAYALHVLQAASCQAEGNYAEAREHLTLARQEDADRPSLHIAAGRLCVALRGWGDAERCFIGALDLDADSAEAYLGLADSYLPRRRYVDAARAALDAIERRFYFPQAHLRLGIALVRLRRVPLAVKAFEVALAQNPGLADAHSYLAAICRTHLADPARAAVHQQAARRIRRVLKRPLAPAVANAIQAAIDAPIPALRSMPAGKARAAVALESITAPITIVSGLPRSGTSMMMRMLAAGGLAPLTDDARAADSDNPHGYFEFAPARRLRDDASWLPQAAGKAVKIVAQLLASLPPGPHYRVLFMRRDLDEVLASQHVMLRRTGRPGADIPPERLRAVFAAQIEDVERTLASRPGVSTLSVAYRDVVQSPAAAAARVNSFLGGTLDEEAMAVTVDATLWRQRA